MSFQQKLSAQRQREIMAEEAAQRDEQFAAQFPMPTPEDFESEAQSKAFLDWLKEVNDELNATDAEAWQAKWQMMIPAQWAAMHFKAGTDKALMAARILGMDDAAAQRMTRAKGAEEIHRRCVEFERRQQEAQQRGEIPQDHEVLARARQREGEAYVKQRISDEGVNRIAEFGERTLPRATGSDDILYRDTDDTREWVKRREAELGARSKAGDRGAKSLMTSGWMRS